MGERAARMVAQGEVLSNRYLLDEQIGSGGMGTVYRATDLRTGAHVAVKIPHTFLASDKVYVERLKREAQIAASIHSPRVARVTDFAEHDGQPYLVMEYVPGETISDLIDRRGAIEPVEALHITLEVARALDAAHQRGITHRDLKPQNIRIDDADIRVLDFGIARLEGQKGLTSAGQLIGSPEYLAPERAEGLGDIRSDIYSLGVVLYQMLAGKAPFDGGTPFTILRRHANEAPPPLPAGMPAQVYPIVERCLAKRPEDRYQLPRELILAIQEAQRAIQEEHTSQRLAGAVPPGRTLDLPAVSNPRPPSGEFAAPTVPLPSGEYSLNGARHGSGEFAAGAGRPDSREFAAPPHAAPSAAPAPAKGKTPVVPLVLGALVTLILAAVAVFFLTRDSGGSSAATTTPGTGIAGTGSSGTATSSGSPGAGRTATAVAGQQNSPNPTVEVVFPKDGAEVQSPVRIEVASKGSLLKNPLEGDPNARHVHYFIDIDPSTSMQAGVPIPLGNRNIIHTASLDYLADLAPGKHTIWVVLSENSHIPMSPNVQVSVSFTVTGTPARTGDQAPIVYQALDGARWQLSVIEAAGRAPRQIRSNGNDVDPAWSPDGSKIAFASTREGGFQLWVMNADGSNAQRLTSGSSVNRNPAWSPDGSQIAFISNRDAGKEQVFVIGAGGGEPKQITKGSGAAGKPTWSADGKQLAYYQEVGNLTQIFSVELSGGEPKQLTRNNFSSIDPSWSPDGRRIAFAAFSENVWNIWVMNPDGSDPAQLTLRGEVNRNPAWSPDGRQLVFASGRSENQQVFSISLDGGSPRRLTEGFAHSINPSWPRK